MRYKKIWLDDNGVEISKKNRVHRSNRKVSGEYERFSPEDLSFETDEFEVNATVNKESYHCSNYLEDSIKKKSHLIDKCGRTYYGRHYGNSLGKLLERDLDIDFGDDDEC